MFRKTFLLSVLFATSLLTAQAPAAADPAADVSRSLAGHWAGYLEYRDYSEPPTSTKRVQLPTWLEITANGNAVDEHFIYDDGPNKVVEGREHIAFDVTHKTYSAVADRKTLTLQVEGFDALKSGLGTLTLTGGGIDNGKPAEMRITFRIRRNLIEWIEEARPAGSSEPFAFRHMYRFTRAEAPTVH